MDVAGLLGRRVVLFGIALEGASVRSTVRAAVRELPIALLVGLFVITGARGVDFGFHWDEVDWQIKPARLMVDSGTFLPRSYIYPSFAKWLVLVPSLPAVIGAVAKTGDPRAIQTAWVAAIDAPGYLLHTRELFLFVSALAIVWVYAAALVLRRARWEALVAAAGLGLSWEYAYHARWVATDCVVVQFSALTLLLLAAFHRTGRAWWLYAAAVAAGLGTGTKFPAVVLLVPVLISGAMALPLRALVPQARRTVALCALAFATYLVTTPAMVLDPFAFAEQLRGISDHYKEGHGGYTVSGALQHWILVLTYFALEYFSPFRAMAIALFAATVVGAVAWARDDRRMAVLLIGFPIAFLLFFCGKYRVVIVRNYLLIAPFFSILAARGLAEVFNRLPRPWARVPLAAALVLGWSAGAVFLVEAAESIRHVDPQTEVRDAITYVARRPQKRFRLSSAVRASAAQQKVDLPPNVASAGASDDVVFFARAEGPNPWHWKTNDPFLTQAVFGPREINFNWYSTWAGADRVVVMTTSKAKEGGVAIAQ